MPRPACARAQRPSGYAIGRGVISLPGAHPRGGSFLLIHFHEGRLFHVDAVYLQHAAMGLAVLAIGITLLVAQRIQSSRRILQYAWTGCLVLLALFLLLYSES